MQEQVWSVVQPHSWEADLCAVAISRRDAPRHLVYVSTCESKAGRYYHECEARIGTDETDYIVVDEGADVSFVVRDQAEPARHQSRKRRPHHVPAGRLSSTVGHGSACPPTIENP